MEREIVLTDIFDVQRLHDEYFRIYCPSKIDNKKHTFFFRTFWHTTHLAKSRLSFLRVS